MAFPIPANEPSRLKSLNQLDMLDTPAEERFDRLTRIAAALFHAPICMVTLLDGERQWFKSAQGHLLSQTPRSEAFCAYTICRNKPLVVPDAAQDERFSNFPAVTHMGIRFYAGAPIYSPQREPVGTFCVLDLKSREFSEPQLSLLGDLVACAQSELSVVRLTGVERSLRQEVEGLQRQAQVDPVTRCWKEGFSQKLLQRQVSESQARREPLVIVVFEMKDLKGIDEQLGREATDELLRTVANRIRRAMGATCSLGRVAADRFLLLLPDCELKSAGSTARRILEVMQPPIEVAGQRVQIEYFAGLALAKQESAESLYARAEKALKHAKRGKPGSLDIAV